LTIDIKDNLETRDNECSITISVSGKNIFHAEKRKLNGYDLQQLIVQLVPEAYVVYGYGDD
jgi:hypothetical protein